MSKYRNVRTEVDGITFASKKEAKRYWELKLLERAGEITGLELQRRFTLEANGQKICEYVSDFDYFDRHGSQVVEDAKGVRTPVYKLKKRLMKVLLGIDVQEIL